jgi:ketosteroid isomerase-like protein
MSTFKSLAAAVGLITLLALFAVGRAVAQGGPEEVQQRLLSALSRGDIDAALALFTDDAVIDSQSGACADKPCVGKAAIRKDLERLATDKTRRVTPLHTYTDGNVLVTRFEARSAIIQGAGFDRIVLWGIREMRGGKIAALRCCLPERTDAQTARFLEWEEEHPAAGQ